MKNGTPSTIIKITNGIRNRQWPSRSIQSRTALGQAAVHDVDADMLVLEQGVGGAQHEHGAEQLPLRSSQAFELTSNALRMIALPAEIRPPPGSASRRPCRWRCSAGRLPALSAVPHPLPFLPASSKPPRGRAGSLLVPEDIAAMRRWRHSASRPSRSDRLQPAGRKPATETPARVRACHRAGNRLRIPTGARLPAAASRARPSSGWFVHARRADQAQRRSGERTGAPGFGRAREKSFVHFRVRKASSRGGSGEPTIGT